MTLAPPDVMGAAEVCAHLKISHQAFHRHHRHRPDFPPAAELNSGPVYERRAITAYQRQRATGKPYLTVLEYHRSREAGQLSYAAIGAMLDPPISPTTVRNYLQQLGEVPR